MFFNLGEVALGRRCPSISSSALLWLPKLMLWDSFKTGLSVWAD